MINKNKLASEWTREKLQGLKEGLALVGEHGGFWPDEESFRLAHSCYSAWATELVVLRASMTPFGSNRPGQILLALYEDGVEEFRGMWHIPGGYNRKSHRSMQETCSAVAQREIGVDVKIGDILDQYLWQPGEHPYGTPLSLYVRAEPLTPIVETDKLRFFYLHDLPESTVRPHRRFIGKILQ